MKKINRYTLAMSIFMLCLITASAILLSNIRATTQTNLPAQGWMSATVAICLAAVAGFHVLALLSLVLQFRYLSDDSFLRSATFVVGIFSSFLLTVDLVMAREIGNEYRLNHNITGEWNILFAGHAIHALFAGMMIFQCRLADQSIIKKDAMPFSPALKDEVVFLTVHQIGIFSAILGFLCTILLNGLSIPKIYLTGLLFFSTLILLMPYGVSAAYWFYTKRKEKPTDWYDEKQFMDISRGALITLVISVFAMIAVYASISLKIISTEWAILFPIYLFLTLLMFSGSTLYFSKRG